MSQSRNNGDSVEKGTKVIMPVQRTTSAKKTSKKKATPKAIVGVDFGTTNTGVSYVSNHNSDPRDIRTIDDWPNGGRTVEQLVKFPTRIAYPQDNPSMRKITCGNDIEPGSVVYTWWKLLLDANTIPTEFDDPSLQESEGSGILQLPEGMTPEDLTRDFLKYVYDIVMDRLDRFLNKAILKLTVIEFWITVPAGFGDGSKQMIRRAAEAAGFASRSEDKLFMINEPEAAALAILSKSIEDGNALYKVKTGVHFFVQRQPHSAHG